MLRQILPAPEALVFDIGANRGAYTSLVLDTAPGRMRVHSFEPSPAAYAELARRFSHDDRVETHNIGFSDEEGPGVLLSDSEGSELGSLHHRAHLGERAPVEESVRLCRVDSFCGERGITRIDLLKVDTEGHDLRVLRGAGALLDGRAIRAIQFEHGGTAPDARVFLRDFFDLLDGRYLIHRVLPDGLWPLRRYRSHDEIPLYANYVALSTLDGGR